jgi:hypothetical protein
MTFASVLFYKWGNIASGVGDKSGVKSDNVFDIILHNYKEATKGFNSQITYIWGPYYHFHFQPDLNVLILVSSTFNSHFRIEVHLY